MENKYYCIICSQEISSKIAIAQNWLSDPINTKEKNLLFLKYIKNKICPECKQEFKKTPDT